MSTGEDQVNDNFDLDSLANTWQKQPEPVKFDEHKLKRKLFLKRFTLFALTAVEVLILAALAWFIREASKEPLAVHTTVFYLFAMAVGLVTLVAVSLSRFRSFKMLNKPTSELVKYERQISHEAIKRGKYTNYIIAAFSLAVLINFTYEQLFTNQPAGESIWQNSLGALLLILAWLANRKQINKHQVFLKNLE